MKNYRQLVESLPPKTIVFAFGRFNPPTTGHELLIKAVKKLASNNNAAHAIYASKTQNSKKDPLPVDKKVQYLNLLFPNTNFVAASAEVASFIQAAEQLNKKYKNLIMVAGSDRVMEFTRILNTYNGKNFNFDSIQVISAGERDPDADNATGMSATKMRTAASKGEYAEFKQGLPSHVRDIDAKRLMNDVRLGLGLEVIKEQIKFTTDEIREKYFQGEVFLEGQIVESEGIHYTIIKRGSNHLLIEDKNGNKLSKWIKDVTLVEDVEGGAIPTEVTFNGYTTKNLHHSEDAIRAFISTIERFGDSHHDEDILHALKATDAYMKINDMHLEQGISPDEKELEQWRATHAEARIHLAKMGEFMHHMDYWHNHEHELQLMTANYAETGAEMNEELTTKTLKPTDKLKVARMISDFLGVEGAEKSSNPENLVNLGLRKIKNKPLHAESISILNKMLKLAAEVGIEYDTKLVPQKMKEEVTDRVVAIDKKSKRNGAIGILSMKDFNKLNKPNIKEQAINPATGDIDTEDDTDELRIVDVDGREVAPQQIKHTKVGHSLASPHDDTNRRMKVRYKTEEVDLGEAVTQPNGTDAVMPRGSSVEVTKKLKTSPVKDDSYQLGANNGKGFDAFFEEAEDDCSEDELESMANSINDVEDVMDVYDDDELAIIDDEGEEIHSSLKEEVEALNEVLSRMERIKAKIRFARSESKRERKIQVALKRHSDTKTLNNRARRLAIVTMKKRLAKKPLDKLSVGEKERIEGIIQRRKVAINRLAMKMVPRVRKIENDRLAHKKYTKA